MIHRAGGLEIVLFLELQDGVARLGSEESALLLVRRCEKAKLLEVGLQQKHVPAGEFDFQVSPLQVHGGAGYRKDLPLERYVRDAKITQIYEGTNQILRQVIARHIIG